MHMRRLLAVLSLIVLFSDCPCFMNESKAQDIDSIAFLQSVADYGNLHKGEKVSVIVNKFKEMGISVILMGLDTTSPWIDSEAKSYVTGIDISCYDGDTLERTGRIPILCITYSEPYMLVNDFVKAFCDEHSSVDDHFARLGGALSFSSVKFLFIPVHYGEGGQ